MAVQQGQLRSNELPEFPIRGPFGGIQSELPPEFIEQFGFADARNILFWKGVASVRSAFIQVTRMPDPQESIVGVSTFDDLAVIATPTRLLTFDKVNWAVIPPGGFTGGPNDLFTFDVVGDKFCFSQGVDKVKVWDGAAPFADAAAAAVPARYVAEIDNHLVAANCVVGGVAAPQRVFWTGAGDPTDWASFNSGQTDLFNSSGVITGLAMGSQFGFITQQLGIVLMIPTGIGIRPFDFIPVVAGQIGNVCPHSLDVDGMGLAYFVGQDNVYTFNGSGFASIGDAPLSGRVRVGARSRIFADLLGGDLNKVFGVLVTTLGGVNLRSYWLFIPGRAVWVFNIEEVSWTRFDLLGHVTKSASMVTMFHELRIFELVGNIGDQTWSPSALTVDVSPNDCILIGCEDGAAIEWDFTTGPIEDTWTLKTGQMAFGDYRHEKTLKKLRLVYQDLQAAVQISVHVLSDTKESQDLDPNQLLLGTGSGKSVTQVVDADIAGHFLEITISGPAGSAISFSEITPIYDIGGEITNAQA